MTNREHHSELEKLLAGLVEGSITDDQFAKLDELLLQNPGLQEEYKRYIELHATLQYELRPHAGAAQVEFSDAAGACRSLGEVSSPSAPANSRIVSFWAQKLYDWRAPATIAAAVAIAVLIAEIWTQYRNGQNIIRPVAQSVHEPIHQTPTTQPAAYLMSANGCNWRGEPMTYAVGSSVQAGDEISLLEGVAEFRLASGVSLLVEGPATMLLASPSTVVLQRGKLMTQVPWGVNDFKAIIGGYRLVARDAEFGIDFTSNKLAIHVFSGAVQCDPPPTYIDDFSVADEDDEDFASESKPVPASIRVRENYAIELTPDAQGLVQQRSVPLDPRLFAAKLPMSGSLPIAEAYVNSVKRSKPISYWRFESAKHGKISNEVAGASAIRATTTLNLPGDETNHVIDLGPNSYQARDLTSLSSINLMETGNYSVEAWIKPSHYHRGVVFCLGTGKRRDFVLETLPSQEAHATGHPATIRFFHRSNLPGGGESPTMSCFLSNLYSLRQWQHVVAVKQDSVMRLYLDGKESGVTKSVPAAVPHELKLVLGRRFHGERYDEENRFFVGQLDELAIYNRALSKQEVAEHFKAVDFKEPMIKAASSPDI